MTVAVGMPPQEMSSCLDSLRAGLSGLDDNGIVAALREIEEISRRTYSVMLDVVAETESRGIAVREGFGSTARLLSATLRLSAAEARSRVDQAAAVGARRALTGELLAPTLPATAAGLADGGIGTGQLRVITETMATLPASVPEPVRERVEADLAGYARDFDPRRLRIISHRVLGTLDPDGDPPAEEPPVHRSGGELWLRLRRDGRLGIEGWLDAENGTMVRALIEQLAAPRPNTTGPTTVDGTRDTRTVPQRQADALIELCEKARATEEFPTAGGEPPHVTVTMHLDALRAALGAATLDFGQPLPAAEARRLACDAKLIPAVLGADSEPLDLGRAARTAPLGLRRALALRDRGCCFPGCDRPPGLTAVHHLRHWADGGETSVHNCCLLCAVHHQQVHRQHWDLRIIGGRVEFRPPKVIDPEQKPLVNPRRP